MTEFLHVTNSFLLSSDVNIKFSQLRDMDKSEFSDWVSKLQSTVKKSWVEYDQPPIKAVSEEGIVSQYHRLVQSSSDIDLAVDGLTQTKDCILQGVPISAASSFFSNMGKMKDINSNMLEGDSLWSLFVEGKNFEKLFSSVKRNILKDSFLQYAPVLTLADPQSESLTAMEWLEKNTNAAASNYNYWLEPTKLKSKRGNALLVRGDELQRLGEKVLCKLDHWAETRIDHNSESFKKLIFRIRLYDDKIKVFPKAFHCFRQGMVVMGVNFPPTIAKKIYAHFTKKLPESEPVKLYDPSSGYGGRLLGALSLLNERNIHYIGTDPNSDNWIDELSLSRYELLARHFNANVRGRYQTSYEIHKCGSEVFSETPEFLNHRGTVDLIFTSPPYFAAEGYSEDETQSYKKFPSYDLWRDQFLRKTLENCVELLKPDRWILWNIADVSFDGKLYPLERDSVEIAKSLGLVYKKRLKMVLSGALSGKKINKQTRQPTTKNYCAINNIYRKYEPIFCFYKE